MPPTNAPDDASVTRFRDDLIALTGPLDESARIGVAVSGGPDSLALLLLAHAVMPGRIAAATVDHGLRPEAADEAAMVGRVCRGLGVPHNVLSDSVKVGNVQAMARILRYGLLANWAGQEGLGFVATAHHRDDVAESFLMRALRGSGIGGLARMTAIGPIPHRGDDAVRLVRPLLGWSREELAGIIERAAIVAAHDPSNDDPRYDRVRVRSLLRREPLLDADQLARAAANLADAETALEWIADQAWKSRLKQESDAEIALDPADLPLEIRRRLLFRAVARLAPDWNGEGLDRLLAAIDAGDSATLAGVKASGGDVWRFSLAPARRDHR